MKNKLARTLAFGLTLILSVGALASCGSEYDYELSEYIKLSAYKGVELSTAEVDKSVQEQINALLENKATSADIGDRAAENGDTVNIDYAGKIDGEAFEGGTNAGTDITLGKGGFVEGFESGIVGMKVGETKTIKVTFPKDYGGIDVAGKDAEFEIKMNSAKKTIIPELNDEFIVSLDNGFATVDEYKADLVINVKKSIVWNSVVKDTTVISYPKKEVKTYYDKMISTYERLAANYGVTLSTYVTSYGGTNIDTFFGQVTENAKLYVKNDMVLNQIVRLEKLSVSDADYEKYGMKYAKNYDYATLKEYEDAYGKEEVKRNVLSEVVGDFVLTNAVIVD